MKRWLTTAAALIAFAMIPTPSHAGSVARGSESDIPPRLVLDPTSSYGVVWETVNINEEELVSAEVEAIDNINTFFDLEDDGLIVIGSIHEFTRDGQTELVYESGFDIATMPTSPRVNGSRCSDNPNERPYVVDDNASLKLTYGYGSWMQSHDIEYYPNCNSYPCTRYAKGGSGWPVQDVWTDFSWRSGTGSYNYWTTQVYPWTWIVSLYSGDRSINYLERTCAQVYTTLYFNWW